MKLDPQTGTFIDLGQAIPGDGFVWTLALGADGLLYGGTSSSAHLFRVDPTTDIITDLGRVDPIEQYLRILCAGPDGWIYGSVGVGGADYIAYFPPTGELRHLLPVEQRVEGFTNLFNGADGEVYGGHLGQSYHLRDGALNPIFMLPAPRDRTCWQDGRPAEESAGYAGNSMVIHRVGEGPDGNIYASSIQPEYLLRFDPTTGACDNLGLIPGAEAYSFLAAYERLFIASYTHSTLQIYDPARHFDPSVERDPTAIEREKNPANYGPVAPHQQRPYDMVMGTDGKIYLASVAGYGFIEGALAWYDPRSDRVEYVTNPLGAEHLTALCALPDGRLVVASSPDGGKADARLFLWDTQTRTIVSAAVAPVPGEPEVANLTLGGDGKLYGSACQQLFVLEPETLRVLALGRSPESHIRRAGMLTLPDGRVVALAGTMAVFLRYTDDRIEIEPFAVYADWPWVGKGLLNGYLYAGSNTELIRCRIPGL